VEADEIGAKLGYVAASESTRIRES
jgi:hypothetical protein